MVGFLADKIKRHYDNNLDFLQALVYADSKQVGKSVYCLKTMYQVYEDWDKVFDFLFFKPVNFVSYVRELVEDNKKIPVLTWDDAGVHAGSDLYHSNKRLYYGLSKVLQTIGNVVQCVLITSTSVDTPTGILTDDRNITIKIVKTDKYSRKAKLFVSSTLPWGKTMDSKKAFDKFNVMMDNDVYKRYEKLRMRLTKSSLDNFLDSFNKEPDKMTLPD